MISETAIPKTTRRPMTIKKLGGLRSRLPYDVLEVNQAAKVLATKLVFVQKGETKHRRQGLHIPGNLLDHLDSCAHHLALATCQHIGSPCTFCLAWADLEVLSLALEKRADDVIGSGTSRLAKDATGRINQLLAQTIPSSTQKTNVSGKKDKDVTVVSRRVNSKRRGVDRASRTASIDTSVSTSTTKRQRTGPGKKKGVSKRVKKTD